MRYKNVVYINSGMFLKDIAMIHLRFILNVTFYVRCMANRIYICLCRLHAVIWYRS